MAGLEDIPKKQIFNTPEHYFDKLPGKIQSRISAAQKGIERAIVFRYALRYAVPFLVIAAIVLFYSTANPDAETILATVETEELIIYLQESGMTTEEVLENVEFMPEEIQAIETEVYDQRIEGIDETETFNND